MNGASMAVEQWQMADAMQRLRQFAYARNRLVDRVPRTVTFTDDECEALLAYIDQLRELIDEIGP